MAANNFGSVMGTSLTDLSFLGTRVRPRKEKASQERSFFLHKEGWDVPIFILT